MCIFSHYFGDFLGEFVCKISDDSDPIKWIFNPCSQLITINIEFLNNLTLLVKT